MNASTGTRASETAGSLSMRRNARLTSTTAMPARPASAAIGSCRASTASCDSSRSDANTARGATSTAGARSHQLRSRADVRTASVLTACRLASAAMDPELTEQVHEAAPFTGFLGMEIVSASPDEVRSRLAWSADKCTAGGMLHGGALMSLADSAGGFLAFLNLPADAKGTATIESKTNFLGPIRGGYVNAVSRALHKGKRTIVVDTELFDDDGKLVARVTQTQAVL